MQGSLVMTAIKQQLDVIMSAQQKAPEMKCIESLFTKLSGSFNEEHGGFGGAPRFPQPSTLKLIMVFAHDSLFIALNLQVGY